MTDTSKSRLGFLSDMQRYPGKGWIAGVCQGIADYFDWKVKLVRLAVVVITIVTAFWPVFLVYCFFWYLMDEGDLLAAVRPKWNDLPATTANASYAAAGANSGSADIRDIKERFARLDARLRRMEEAALSKDEALRREFDKLERDGDTPKSDA